MFFSSICCMLDDIMLNFIYLYIAGEKKCLNSELWHACAGPLVSLPQMGSRVVYFPQGHSEQVVKIFSLKIHDLVVNFGFVKIEIDFH